LEAAGTKRLYPSLGESVYVYVDVNVKYVK